MNKLKALIQWFMALEVQEHKHWCKLEPEGNNTGRCEYQPGAWMCKGIFCVNVNLKDCPNCARLTDK